MNDLHPQRLMIVSCDGHVGAPVEDYRDYVDPDRRGDFDEWLAGYDPMWIATQAKDPNRQETLSESYKREWMRNEKVAQGAQGTWDAASRLRSLDADGIVADVLFPDDQSANPPPFMGFTREFNRPFEKECPPALKLAGARAYNRWLADFCAAAPDRLLGLALVGTLADVEGAVAEVRWAKANGLAGVVLPLVYYNIHEPFWNDPGLDPLWAACAELGMPIHTHTGQGSPYYGTGDDAAILFALECTYWPHRPLWFLTLSGVFERHPGLRLMLTEQGSHWVPEMLATMDAMAADPKFAYSARKQLSMKPSDYFHRQCWLGSSLVRRFEIEQRQAIGVDKMMWGWDFPHIESADWLTPRDNIRAVMKGVPEGEVRAILAGNAIEAYRLDASRLQPIADEVGPRTEELMDVTEFR
jgi:predicted TIM-barrel fold metal-dependent hydrolase